MIGKEEGDVVEGMPPGGPKPYEIVKGRFIGGPPPPLGGGGWGGG